jgi:hypothetical protein
VDGLSAFGKRLGSSRQHVGDGAFGKSSNRLDRRASRPPKTPSHSSLPASSEQMANVADRPNQAMDDTE